MEIGGHHRQRPHLGGAGDGEGLPEEVRDSAQALLDGRSQEDDGRRAGEGELEADVPGQLRSPAEHGRGGQGQGGPDVGGPAGGPGQ